MLLSIELLALPKLPMRYRIYIGGKAVNDILYFSDEDMTEKNNGAFAEKILEKQKQIVAMVDVDGIISKYSDPEMKDFEIEETWEIYDILMGE